MLVHPLAGLRLTASLFASVLLFDCPAYILNGRNVTHYQPTIVHTLIQNPSELSVPLHAPVPIFTSFSCATKSSALPLFQLSAPSFTS